MLCWLRGCVNSFVFVETTVLLLSAVIPRAARLPPPPDAVRGIYTDYSRKSRPTHGLWPQTEDGHRGRAKACIDVAVLRRFNK